MTGQQNPDETTTAEAGSAEKKAPAPFFEITGGNPSPTEVGILAAVLATAEGNAAHQSEHPTGIRNDWGSYEDRLRTPFGYNPSSFLNQRQY